MKIFKTFEFLGQILLNSLCQFWNNKSILLQILYLSSVSWKITPLYIFSSNNIYFAWKESIKMKLFGTFFECSCQNLSNFLCQFWNNKSILPRSFVSLFCFMKDYSSVLLAQKIYTLFKRSPLKWRFLRLLTARVKFCQIPYAYFKKASRFLPKFCIPLQFHER